MSKKPLIYLNDWGDFDAVIGSFRIEELCPTEKDIEILLASYTYEDYSGSAYVLYMELATGKLFEVHGSHCSCYGLECQWEPEETFLGALEDRIKRDCVRGEYASEYKQMVKRLKRRLVNEEDE